MEDRIPLDILRAIQLLGAAQGVFLAAVLFRSRSNQVANRILAVAMLAFALDLVSAWFLSSGLESKYPHFLGVDYPTPFLYGPVFFAYARIVAGGGDTFPAGLKRHFVPLVVLLLLALPFYLQTGDEKLAIRLAPATSPWTPWLTGLNFVKLGYSLVYLVLTFVAIRNHRRSVRNWFASEERVALEWLRNMLAGGLAIWMLSLVVSVLWAADGGADPLEGYDDLVSIALAIFIYTIGYLGLGQREVHIEPAKPSAGSLKPSEAAEIRNTLHRTMAEHHAYRAPDLTLPGLAAQVGVTPHKLSQVLNSVEKRSFYDYVNGFRVDDFKRRLGGEEADRFTLLAHALEAGFPSKSSFNSVFKRTEGLTPSEYRKALD